MNKKEIKQRAHRRLGDAIAQRGANCLDNPERFTSDTLPSPEEAAKLCEGCPMLNKECRDYRLTKDLTFGVLDGYVIDVFNLSGKEL